MAKFDSGYKDRTLTKASDKISYVKDGETYNVMMSWEDPIMRRSAEWVTNNGTNSNILELGFGMGISAGYINTFLKNNAKSSTHTIIELHTEIAADAAKFAEINATKSHQINIISGKNWFELFKEDKSNSGLTEYDGIFIDTYQDDNQSEIKNYITKFLAVGGRMTWWNPMEDQLPGDTEKNRRNVSYEKLQMSKLGVKAIPTNEYHNTDTYYMPMYIRKG